MAPTPTIELASADDVDAVVDLWVALARGQREHGSDVAAAPNREAMRETLAAHQVADGLFVARLEDEVVGFASFSIERGALDLERTRGVLSNVYVAPAYRDRGIGTALLERVEVAMRESEASVLHLEVMADNEAARRFYRRHGYDEFRVTMRRSLEE